MYKYSILSCINIAAPTVSLLCSRLIPGWPTLSQRRLQTRLSMLFKMHHNLVAINASTSFLLNNTTRQLVLKTPSHTTYHSSELSTTKKKKTNKQTKTKTAFINVLFAIGISFQKVSSKA